MAIEVPGVPELKESPTVSVFTGCAGVICLGIAWILGFILSIMVAIGAPGSGLLGPRIGFLFISAMIFSLILAPAHLVVLIAYLSRIVYLPIIVVTVVAGIGYWLTAVIIYRFAWENRVFGLVDALQEADRDPTRELPILLAISMVGACAGFISGAILATPQWLFLRQHVRKAIRWLIIIMVGSAVMGATFYYAAFWFSQGSSWN